MTIELAQSNQGQGLVLRTLIELGGTATTRDVEEKLGGKVCGHLLRKLRIWGYVERTSGKKQGFGNAYVWEVKSEYMK